MIISDVCMFIVKGEIVKVMVVGGEVGFCLFCVQIEGVKFEDIVSIEFVDVILKFYDEMQFDYEKDSGFGQMLVGYYVIIDNVFWYV